MRDEGNRSGPRGARETREMRRVGGDGRRSRAGRTRGWGAMGGRDRGACGAMGARCGCASARGWIGFTSLSRCPARTREDGRARVERDAGSGAGALKAPVGLRSRSAERRRRRRLFLRDDSQMPLSSIQCCLEFRAPPAVRSGLPSSLPGRLVRRFVAKRSEDIAKETAKDWMVCGDG